MFLTSLLCASVLGSCSSDDPDESSSTTTLSDTDVTTTTSTTVVATSTTIDETEAEVAAAYAAATAAFEQAGVIPDPDFPGLFETHVDPMLNQVRGVLTQLKFEGAVFRFPEPSVRSLEIESFELRDPETAIVQVCVVDDGERYDVATGQLLTDGQPGTTRFTAGLRQIEGRWLLAEQTVDEEFAGVAGCAVD